MTDRPCDLNEPDGKPRRWHHSWERNNDDDSSNRGETNLKVVADDG